MSMQEARGRHVGDYVPTTSPQAEALSQLLQRIDGMLDEEADLMPALQPEEFDRVIARKNHLALEAARFASGSSFMPDAAMRQRLQQAKARLDENAKVLQRNIDAVGDILALMSDVVNRTQSDGTYTSDSIRQGMRK